MGGGGVGGGGVGGGVGGGGLGAGWLGGGRRLEALGVEGERARVVAVGRGERDRASIKQPKVESEKRPE